MMRMCLMIEKIRIMHRRMSYEQWATLPDVNAMLYTKNSLDSTWKFNGYRAIILEPMWKLPFKFAICIAKDLHMPSRYSFHNILFRTVVSIHFNS